MADDAGALLVRAGLIADRALSSARSAQRHNGGTLGEHLVASGAVGDDALTEFYRSRLMVPQVSPTTLAKLPATVVGLLPADMAVEFRVMPVSLDKDGNLTVAMSDPSDRHAVDEIGFFTGKYVVRAVATQMQIAWCLAHYYDYVTELAERLMQPVAALVKPAAAPAPSAAPTPSRARGDTAKVDAARHRVLVPVTTPPPIAARPGADALDRSGPVGAHAQDQLRSPGPPSTAARSQPRAASVLPPPPVDDDEPEIEVAPTTIELESDEPDDGAFAPEAPLAPPPPPGTKLPPPVQLAEDAFGSPTVVVSAEATRPQRTRPAAPDPPELAARSGELEFQIRDGRVDAPSVTIEINLGDEPALEAAVVELERKRPAAPPPVVVEAGGEVSAPAPLDDREARDELAIVHDALVDTESAPILLEHFRRGEPPPAEAPAAPEHTTDEPSGPVLLLERKKGVIPRRDKRTVLGIGLLGPIPRSTEPPPFGPRGPATEPPPFDGDTEVTRPAMLVASPDGDDGPGAEAVPTVVTDEEAATRRVEVEVRSLNVDDGWEGDTAEKFGPPGTTIPPPFLGAALPIDDPPSGRIPLATSDGDSSRLVVGTTGPVAATPVARDATAPTGPARSRTLAPPPDATVLARQLEEASLALVDLLRGLDGATTRDHVIAMLVDFVGSSHHRVAFLAAKAGELTAFMQVPSPVPGAGTATLSLTTPSTFQDVVGTRLPYRGPIGDAASRGLVKAMFGSPTDDMLAVPVAVRDRVVGVIYADGRHRHSYDEHVTVAGRAAGLALERVLKGKRGA